ncbi:hypothetical protein A3740_03205 [Oleiphilus sp. HI0068]|uniref:hypothetical protein n=1 Tax=Oleiphilus sp. HI0132 TaxID=1822270 RepID=UPI0007C335ED|nr:hypothetical protein [Oleiphilus sp. HI0132]KZY73750.1 hypothetical protein A3740_03205 [Oleiphilus sp. HI0068]KZY84158.1 hypothetical protein A3741_16310 [Oleiphilus sp. HI0069]KZZ47274.1 hypothetical protein A3755_02385 [Oleiphilus sp. HI0085]KZZ76736.1 hypothetical protein A3766_13170 [Oleiphilus sp. HI0132]
MSENKFGKKITCFASSAALQVEATKRHKDGVPVSDTISLELCPVTNQRPEWNKKISIQLSEDELPIYASVLLGYLPKAQFKRQDKGIFLERQKGKVYYRGTAGAGNLFQIPVPIGKSFNMSQLALSQLITGSDIELGSDCVLAALKGVSALYLIDDKA